MWAAGALDGYSRANRVRSTLPTTWPSPVWKNSAMGANKEVRSMVNRVVRTRARGGTFRGAPLPDRDGLGPSRVRVPEYDQWPQIAGAPEPPPPGSDGTPSITALALVTHMIMAQRHRHPEDNHQAIAERFAAKEVVLRDGTALRPDSELTPGTDVWFYRRPAPEKPVPFDLEILHQDSDLVVVHKPPFLATAPRASHITETAVVRLRRQLGIAELSPAHRLDRLTSGVLVFTARREVRGAYQELFARRAVEKQYEAIAPWVPTSPGTVWSSRLFKQHGNMSAQVVPGEPNAFTEVVSAKPLEARECRHVEAAFGPQPPLARYLLRPRTGKTHQLRMHLLAHGAPIVGDPVYPKVQPLEAEDFSRPMLLCSRSVAFVDPLSGRARRFESVTPLLPGWPS